MSELDDFLAKTGVEKRTIVIRDILSELHTIGGIATRQELRRALMNDAADIPEDYFTYQKHSKSNRSGAYKPFDFDFYMSINDLLLTSYLEEPNKGSLQLTQRGLDVDPLTFDAHAEVIVAAQHIRKDRQQEDEQPSSGQGQSDSVPNAPTDMLDDAEADSSEADADDAASIAEQQFRDHLAQAIAQMSPHKFEVFCRALVAKMGVTIDKNLGIADSRDGGIDGYGYIQNTAYQTTRVAIQAKRWTNAVPAPVIDQFRGAIDKFNADYGIFITSSVFTRAAREAARQGSKVITLIDGEEIADLVEQFQLHVTPVMTYVLDDFFTSTD